MYVIFYETELLYSESKYLRFNLVKKSVIIALVIQIYRIGLLVTVLYNIFFIHIMVD